MEKLQIALQKARQVRQGQGALPTGPSLRTTPTATASAPPSPPDTVDDRWAALKVIEPNDRALTRNRVQSLQAGHAATPFDILRTKVLLQMRQNGWKRIAITSPTAETGKTTMACNLAAGLTRQLDIRAMLFDLDLRRPSVARLFGHKPEWSTMDLLNGEVSFAEQAVLLRSNVALSMTPRAAVDPTQLLLNSRTGQMFDRIEAEYQPDLMIFDLPPLLVSDDARAFLKTVDCALLVVRANKSKIHQIDFCEREIAENTNFLGVVLNQIRHQNDDSGYGQYGYD